MASFYRDMTEGCIYASELFISADLEAKNLLLQAMDLGCEVSELFENVYFPQVE
jgi:hypothetical protein